MNKFIKKIFSTKSFSQIPYAPLKSGLISKITGHFKELNEIGRRNNQNIAMVLYSKITEWYKLTNSNTLQIRIINGKYIFTSDPNFYKEIIGSKQDCFSNSSELKIILGEFFKNSMLVLDGNDWLRVRKIVQKALNNKSLDDLVPIICESTEKLLLIKNPNQIETKEIMARVTFDSFHKLMYGWDPKSVSYSKESCDILNNCNILAEAIGVRSFLPISWIWKIPTKNNKRIIKANLEIKDFIKNFVANQRIAQKKNLLDPNYKKSILDELLIISENDSEGHMSNEELYDQIETLFFGAYDTTSNTLSFFLNYLSRYPETQAKLREEILKLFPKGMEDIKKSSLSALESINYMTYYIEEVHRLNGLFPFLARDCIKDVIINNYEVKKGTRIMIDSRTVARNPDYFNGQTDLDKFRPERWEEYKPLSSKKALPFGFGNRICIGRKIALAKIRIFLAAVLSQYEVSLRNPEEIIDLDFCIGLNYKKGIGNINFIRKY